MNIGIFRALKLGDFLCATPAIRCIKENFPHAKIYLIGLPAMQELCKRYAYVDEYIVFPGYPGLPEQEPPADISCFMEQVRALSFDLLLQMHGDGTIVNDLLRCFEAKRLVGFCPRRDQEDGNWLYYPKGIHEIYKHLELLKAIGLKVDRTATDMDFPLFKHDQIKFKQWKTRFQIENYVVVHVGSSSVDRQWPLENFLFLAAYLINNHYQMVLTGVRSERERTEQLDSLLDGYSINMAGHTDLGLLGSIIKHASLVISNCTGTSHIAAATKTKSIVISLDGEPERWAPLNHDLHITYDATRPLQLETIKNDMSKLLAVAADRSGSNGS